ncbi:hypothetical protein F4604DRAFT_1687557 [Suillus subluteus]|nr:hypothetical protein F4604DRAFT_1687557 [Suillus subluteus]
MPPALDAPMPLAVQTELNSATTLPMHHMNTDSRANKCTCPASPLLDVATKPNENNPSSQPKATAQNASAIAKTSKHSNLECPAQLPTPANQWQYSQSDSASTTEILVNGVRTLDSGYKITATPAGGFPIPQLGQSTWCNVSQVLKEKWPQKEGAKAWPLPTYAFTLENFSFPDSNVTNREIAKIVKDTIHSNPDVMQFIHDNIPLPDAEVALHTIELVRVSSINLTLSKSIKKTVWNIYFNSPPAFTLKQYFDWTNFMCTFFYISEDYGYGTAHQDAQFVCMGCKSFNHPTGLCPFPKVPGWFGPSVTKDKDTSNVTLDNCIMTSHGKGAFSSSSTCENRGLTRGHTCGHTRRGRGRGN